MAGLFSLGGGGGGGGVGGGGSGGGGRGSINQNDGVEHNSNSNNNNNQRNEISTEGWFWYRNNEDYNAKGFELWQEQELLHQRILHQQQHQHHQQQQDLYSTASLLGMGPSGRASINVPDESTSSRSAFMMMRTGTGTAGISCQDCGNQAKKDCSHMRCRTCCKSRGYDCSTHVKSTWVPASKRRERQQQIASLHHQQHQQLQLRDNNTTTKRLRETNPSTSPPGLELGGRYPAEVSSQAVFRCVRVSSVDEEEDQYAYQTAVNIGGHLFKGILYDQGPENSYVSGGESSSVGGQQHNQALNLIMASSTTTTAADAATSGAGGGGGGAGTSAFTDPNCLYPAPLNTFFAGTQFFPSPRS